MQSRVSPVPGRVCWLPWPRLGLGHVPLAFELCPAPPAAGQSPPDHPEGLLPVPAWGFA